MQGNASVDGGCLALVVSLAGRPKRFHVEYGGVPKIPGPPARTVTKFRGGASWGGRGPGMGEGRGQGAREGKEQDKAKPVNIFLLKHFFLNWIFCFKIGLLAKGIFQNWIKVLS